MVQFSLDSHPFEHFWQANHRILEEMLHFCMQTIIQMIVSQNLYSTYDIWTRYNVFETIPVSQSNYDFSSHAF